MFGIEECVGLKPKMNSFMVDDSSEHKKAMSISKNIVARIIHSGYKDVLLNYKFLRRSMNKNRNKNHIIATYKISLSISFSLTKFLY